jgi:hypothetical protein
MSYSDGESVKKCLVAVADSVCLNDSNDTHTISLSRHTVSTNLQPT